MKWFLNLTTKSKLSIGFGLIIIMITIMFTNTQSQLNVLWQNQKQQYEKEYKTVVSILKIQSSLISIRMSVLASLTLNSKVNFEEQKQKINDNIQKATDNIEVFRNLIDKINHKENSDRISELKNLFIQFVKTAKGEVLPAIEANNPAEAKKLLFGIQGERLKRIELIVEELRSYSENNMQEKIKTSEEAYNEAILVSIIFSLLALVVSVIAILLFNKIISGPLKKMAVITAKIAEGDLTSKFEMIESKDELGSLSKGFNKMVNSLQNLLQDISETINVLATSSIQISSSSSQLAASSTETATSVSETTTTVEEIRQTTSITNQKAKQVAESAQKAADFSMNGKKTTEDTIEGIAKIGLQMESIADSIIKLSQQSRAISDIISTVNDLAEQTNLLAVNASIEAARAGEQGKGFAVVAQEIKSLADQSKQATTQVRNIIGDIQNAISTAVMATEQGSKIVEASTKQSSQTGDAIHTIGESINESAQLAIQISVSSQEQSIGMDQVALAMESIKQASSQNALTTKQLETAAKSLRQMSDKLKELIKEFRV